MSLEDYVAVKPKYAVYVPHTAGRYQKKRFRKAQCPIVERLASSLMMHGRNNGKKMLAVRIVKHAMEIIHLLTDQNPIQVVVDAVINGGPREDATRVKRPRSPSHALLLLLWDCFLGVRGGGGGTAGSRGSPGLPAIPPPPRPARRVPALP